MEPTTTRQVKDLLIGNMIKLTASGKRWHHVKGLTPLDRQGKPKQIIVTDNRCESMPMDPEREVIIAMAGMNIGAPMKDVRHADLKRVGDSQHTSECPSCGDGVLTMKRSPSSGKLQNSDFCTLCGQVFWYVDLPNDVLTNAGEMDVMKN